MVLAIEGIDRIARDPFIFKYIEDCYGGINILKKSTPPGLLEALPILQRSLSLCSYSTFSDTN